MENRYCFVCDNKIEEKTVDERLTWVCMKCQKITAGYKIEEEYFVKQLRGCLMENEYYMIEAIVLILRSYLKRIKEIKGG